ncbi:hypothetical protein P9954_26680, partial [Serratia nevei]|nr:hypothetical protein [Serratia nevei]
KMPAFEWVHVQLHQQKGMISLSPPTICNSAPRNTIKGFLDMLAVLEQNRTMNWQTLIEGVAIEEDRPSDMDDTTTEESDDDDGLANFKL